jgi:hypothetical protein
MNPEQITEILALRSRNLTPKEIARKLGVRPAEVKDIIQTNGEQVSQERLVRGEIAPIYECLASTNFPDQRFVAAGENPAKTVSQKQGSSMGLTMVLVARQERPGKLVLCNYLVDYNCLGVKNLIGPKQVSIGEYPQLKAKYYSGFDDGYKQISLAQAQAIVLSSLAYADTLGLSPHRDFNEAARSHLGVWDEQLKIWCGDEQGKPLYVAGPHDSPTRIMSILDRSVGKGNYNFITPMDMF